MKLKGLKVHRIGGGDIKMDQSFIELMMMLMIILKWLKGTLNWC